MNEHISDRRLQTFYKRKLHESKYAYAAKILESQVYCAVRVIKAPGYTPGVFIIANNNQATIWGSQRCKSPWSCPICSAKQMAKYASKIASAIDAMKAQGKVGFMITFSLPHLMKYTCKQVYTTLEKTWARFVHHANGSTRESNNSDVFAKFTRAINCKHRIRVGEFTWGKNGWHPHYHCIFFCDKSKLKDVAEWQDKLTERWLHIGRQMLKTVLAETYGAEEAKAEVERLYKYITEPNEGAFISKDANGQARQVQSSEYVCGWGADRELTGNVRKQATAEGHYTPHQLLQIAYEFDELNNREESDKYFKIYIDYALTTFKKFRMRLSPELNKIIKNWRQTHEYIQTLKKKVIEIRQLAGNWRLVCWFKPQQWYQICHLELLPKILELATQPNGKQLITELLLKRQIDITKNGTHPNEELVINGIVNQYTDAERRRMAGIEYTEQDVG